MADIEAGGGGHKDGKRGRKKSSTRVDFTPMVDLGFLLITFFMLTTSMTKPKTMEIQKPDNKIKEEDRNKLKASQALTLILTKDNKIVYYLGLFNDPKGPQVAPHVIGYGPDELRKLLKDENSKRNPEAGTIAADKDLAESGRMTADEYKKARAEIEDKYKDKALFVLIKTDDRARYKNLIDVLDEMSITNIRSYAIVNIIPQETAMAASLVK